MFRTKGVFLRGSCDRYGASERLVSFRFSMTGVCSAPLKLWIDYRTLQTINFAENPALFDAPFLKRHPGALAQDSLGGPRLSSVPMGFE
jgi:hypothetical protein